MTGKKRGIAGLICLLILFSACAKGGVPQSLGQGGMPVPLPQESAPSGEEPSLGEEFQPLPPALGKKLRINGRLVEGYAKEGVTMAGIAEVAEALGAQWETPQGADPRSTVALLFADGNSRRFSTEGTENEACISVKEKGFLLPCGFLEELGFHRYEEGEGIYYTAYPTGDSLPAGVTVPTLMYHAVSDDCWGVRELFVSPSSLEAQLQYLQENGYTTVFFEELSRADEIEKPVLLTFDDGYDDNYTHLFPLLQKYGAKANIFLVTGGLGGEHYLTEDQVRQMQESGLVSFQSHTVSHPYLDECTKEQLHWELSESKAALARLTGKEPFVLCYPFGRYDSAALEVIREYYSFGLLMQDGRSYTTDDDPYLVQRAYVRRNTTLAQFARMISA